ncbi:hypothetical protein AAFC00_007340 [Neodothiora populina]|uniref:Amino acid transporter n=1 Tax=Neodothiora populina TaxID=2781224 RepID=A0ABR3PHY1_9PEZI
MTSKSEIVNVLADEQGGDAHELTEQDEQTQEVIESVPLKYRGTRADKRDMHVLGKDQVLRRNFKFLTILGFASTVIASWELLLPLFSFALTDGGTAILFWGFIVLTFVMLLVYASIAEMASMSPTSGGQYHWVAEYSPPRFRKFLSYMIGWLLAVHMPLLEGSVLILHLVGFFAIIIPL